MMRLPMQPRCKINSPRSGSASSHEGPTARSNEKNSNSSFVGHEPGRSWSAVGLRAVVAAGFAIAILLLPQPTLAALLMMFAGYVAADGALAIALGFRAMQRGAVRQALVLEGAINLALAAAVLIWPAMAAIAFLRLTGAWAIITGALLIAAARRLSLQHGRGLLTLAGVVSATWGLVVSARGLMSASVPDTVAWWLLGYALPFAAALLALAVLLQRREAAAKIR
jgi:uncharacterized membrane protein HdeD (DUF308 family)